MSFFSSSGLAISLPGSELEALDLPGSVTEADVVLSCDLSTELRAALWLIIEECKRRYVPVRIVARPEIFTHGSAEHWLRERLGDVTQHLCISDGTAIKSIAGCDTHVFFYHIGRHPNFVALQRLSKRVPELLASVKSQVNTALAVQTDEGPSVPEPCYLTQKMPFFRPPARHMPFFFNPHSAEDTANRIEQRGEFQAGQCSRCTKTIYVPLTETALHDPSFARAVAKLIVQAFFRTDTLLMLRLPLTEAGPHQFIRQIGIILPALRETGVTIPSGFPPNVLLATDDLSEDAVLLTARPWTMMFHESFDFWRYTEAFYRQAARVLVFAAENHHDRGAFLPLNVALLFGPRATRVWLRRFACT